MELLKSVTPQDFMEAINNCEGIVWMMNHDGDRLNLKSQLCRYIFVTILTQPDLLAGCWLECEYEKDVARLRFYVETSDMVRYATGVQP